MESHQPTPERRPAGKRPFPFTPARVQCARRNFSDRWNDPKRGKSTRLATGIAAVLLLLVFGYAGYILLRLPTVEREMVSETVPQASIVLAADGSEITRFHLENRTWVDLDEISPHVLRALVATEDHRFYAHDGVDLWRTIGSTFKTIGGDEQGGSTITQQLARNAFEEVGRRRSVSRKLREMLTALQLESKYSKDEILAMYLNTVPFNHNAYGIEAAAHTYFSKPARDLTLPEAATLVGMLKATTYYNPVRNPERAVERRNVVIDQMVKHGYLDEAEAAQARSIPLDLRFNPPSTEDNLAPHFAEYLRQWMKSWGEEYGYDIYTDGLVIHTTIDPELQRLAREAVARQMEGLQAVADVEWSRARPPFFGSLSAYESYRANVRPFEYFWNTRTETVNGFIKSTERYRRLVNGGMSEAQAIETLRADQAYTDSLRAVATRVEAGLVAMDPKTRHVVAWVGGKNFEEDQYDHVALAKRQPGSTFKPFVYAAAIDNGYSPYHQLRDQEVEIRLAGNRVWRPSNAGGNVSNQPMTLYDGLTYSKNTITAQLINLVGPQQVAQLARRMGIQSELQAVPSLALGTSEVSLLELTNAYATFAAMGRYAPPVLITRIEDDDGRVLAQFNPSARQVISASTAYTTLDMMRKVVERGTGVRIRNVFGVGGDVAGKTGTTQNSADGWFMLTHPDLVTGSWVGFNNQSLSFRSDYWGQGGHNALYVVGDFLRRAQRNGQLENSRFQPPPGYVEPQPPMQPDSLLYYTGYDYEDFGEYDDRDDDAYRDSLLNVLMSQRESMRDSLRAEAERNVETGEETADPELPEAEEVERTGPADPEEAEERERPQAEREEVEREEPPENETKAERIKRIQERIKERKERERREREQRRDSTSTGG